MDRKSFDFEPQKEEITEEIKPEILVDEPSGIENFEELEQKGDAFSIFQKENLEKITELRDEYKDLGNLDDYSEEKGKVYFDKLKNVSLKISELILKAKENGLDSNDVFGTFMDDNELLKRKEDLLNVQNGTYIPLSETGFLGANDGGDGWYLEKDEKGETGFILDTKGHGDGVSKEKVFVQKIFEELEKVPEDERGKYMAKTDSIFENIFHAGGNTVASYARMKLESNGDRKKIKLEKYGDSLVLIYDPKENKIFFHGGISDKVDKEKFIELKTVSESGEEKNLGIPPIGYGFLGLMGSAVTYENDFSAGSEFLLSSDGITDPHMKFKGDRNIDQVLTDFIEMRNNGQDIKLIDYLNKEVLDADPDGKVDDITFISVGSNS